MKKSGWLFVLLFLSVCVLAQQHTRYVFNRFGKINGLAADAAHAVTQDAQGFIWIATANGLQRYDGKRFLTFRHNPANPSSLPEDHIQLLLLDKKGRLWVKTTGHHIGIFNTQTFRYTPSRISLPKEARNNPIARIFADADNTLQLLVSNYGVVTYQEDRNEFSASFNKVSLPDGSIPGDIRKDQKKGYYWVSHKKGFDLYHVPTRRFVPREQQPIAKHLSETVAREKAFGPKESFTDSSGIFITQIWSETRVGPDVIAFNPKNGQWTSYKKSIDDAAKAYHEINGILQQRNGDLWVYGHTLFARLNENSGQFEDVRNETLREHGIDVENVYDLYEDKEENIWVSCSNGLYVFNPGAQVFTNIPHNRNDGKPHPNFVANILQRKNGNIYVAAWGAGIFAYTPQFQVAPNPFLPTPKENEAMSAWDILDRENGEIWMGMQTGVLRIYQPENKLQKILRLPVFESHTLRQIKEDKAGNIWIGTQAGLLLMCEKANWRNPAAFKLVQRLKGHVVKILPDQKGNIWVCTDLDGLYKINAESGEILRHYTDQGLPGKTLRTPGATDVIFANDSILLVGSYCINILNTNTHHISFFDQSNGLPASGVRSFVKDRSGAFWIGMQDGICRYEFESGFISSFGSEDGILNGHCQLSAAKLLNDGRIAFGTTTDLLLANPNKTNIPHAVPPVKIAAFSVSNQSLPVDSLLQLKKITLPHHSNSITIDLTTLTYSIQYGILYKMEGLDDEWQLSTNKQALYNYLAPGTYTFKTKLSQIKKDMKEVITEITIVIEPPFWNSWWFYGLLLLCAMGVLYLLDRARINRIKQTQQLRTDIALNLHQDVNTTLNNINLLSEMARMKIDKDLPRSKELIDRISEKSNTMITAMDDMLWAIDPASDTMEKMALRLREYTDTLRARFDAEITTQADQQILKLKMDMKRRYGLFVIFKEALRCMVEYMGGRNTHIQINVIKNQLSLKIKDETALDHENIHLPPCIETMHARAEEINALLDVQTDRHGAGIVLLIPLS